MDRSITNGIKKILSHDFTKTLFIYVIFFTFNLSILFGFLSSFIVFGAYFAGFYLLHLSLKHVKNLGGILSAVVNIFLKKYYDYDDHIKSRTENDLNRKVSPVFVAFDIDNALEKLLNRILDQYVSNWYTVISADADFLYEIRGTIQYIVSVCYKRISQIKLEEFLYKKALPICFNHINSYEEIKTKVKISDLHIAVHSRKAEILYLQNVSKCLLKYILSKSKLSCKSYNVLLREILAKGLLMSLSDATCNPSILNPLFLSYLNGNFQFLTSENKNAAEKIQLLHNFTPPFRNEQPYSALSPEFATIMGDQDLLDAFMRYLKNIQTDNLLQFCIDIENFSERIRNPCLEIEELDYLYRDAWDLYSVYFSHHSPNCIKFPNDIASTLRKALSKDVLKLRTSNTLYEAHAHVQSQLENYCYEFRNSTEFYSWLYGQSESSKILKSKNSPPNSPVSKILGRKTVFEFGNKLNKIKDVLKPNLVQEGQIIAIQNRSVECETSTEIDEDVQMAVNNERNLNSWKISIPTVGSRLDPVTNKAYTVFVIQIQTEDHKEWIVERRPIDFYSLDVKLTEFHGPSINAQLPPRRLLTTRLESIQLYEEYLHKLIKSDVLKNSELLCTFLTSIDEFETEDSSLGKLFRKSVVPNLRKERGQNLEPFLNSFFNSCKTTKYEWKDVGEKLSKMEKLRESSSVNIYENNFDINPQISKEIFFNPSILVKNEDTLILPSTSLLYLGIKVYNLQTKIAKFLLSLQTIFGEMVDQILIHLTKRFFCNLLTSRNISYLINMIERVMFDAWIRPNPDDVKNAVNESLNKSKKSFLYPLYILVYKTVQDPMMNKQLFYRLMDAAILELFPELDSADRATFV